MTPKMRDDLIVVPRTERGHAVFVIKNPDTGRFFQVGENEHAIMRLMDGTRTIEEIRQTCAQEHRLDVEAAMLEGFAAQMGRAGFLEMELGHQAAFLKPQRGRLMALVGSILYWRVAALRPDRFLTAIEPRLRFFFTPMFVAAALGVIVTGLSVLASNSELVGREARMLGTLEGLALLWVAVCVIIGLHELAHGLTCKHFGGKVPEMGFLMILLAFPCFFTNVSDAWLFPAKRHRLWVTAAGVFFEAFLWSLAILAWRVTAPESTLHQLALAVITASGIGMLFSFNPLVKFDGYYFLSDWLEVPNLRGRSFAYMGRWMWKSATGAAAVLPDQPARLRRIYLTYGLGALAYTMLIIVSIMMLVGSFLWTWFGGVGAAIFAALLVMLLGKPLWHMAESAQQLAQQHGGFFRRRRVQILLGMLAIAAVVSCFVQLDLKISGPFVLDPAQTRDVSAEIQAFVTQVHVRQGDRVAVGSPLITLDSTKFESAMAEAKATLSQAEADLDRAERGPRPQELAAEEAKVAMAQQELDNAEESLLKEESLKGSGAFDPKRYDLLRQARDLAIKKLEASKKDLELLKAGSADQEKARLRARVDELKVRVRTCERDLGRAKISAPIDGVVVTEHPERLVGAQAEPGKSLLTIHAHQRLRVEIRVPEKELAEVASGQTVVLKVQGYPDRTFEAVVTEIAPVISSADEKLLLPNHVIVRCEVPNADGVLKPGMTGEARIVAGRRTAMALFTRRVVRWLKIEFWW